MTSAAPIQVYKLAKTLLTLTFSSANRSLTHPGSLPILLSQREKWVHGHPSFVRLTQLQAATTYRPTPSLAASELELQTKDFLLEQGIPESGG